MLHFKVSTQPPRAQLTPDTAALEATDPVARVLDARSGAESETMLRMQAYFSDMTPESVRATTADVYADSAWLYDNIAVVEGLANVEAYLAKAADETDALTVEFLQVAHTGVDYFIRWRMTITASALGGGEPVVSYGVTQFRFNNEGRVVLHRDFWDASTGMYESLPVVGGLISRLRAKLAEMPAEQG